MENNTKLIKIEDKFSSCLGDNLWNPLAGFQRGPSGYVKIYDNDSEDENNLIGKHNLVVYGGREWLLTKAFNIENNNISSVKDEYICWFGLGTGGCLPGDPFDPISPTNLDVGLTTECPMNTSDSNCADYKDGAYYKHPFDSLTFDQDPDNDNKYLIMEIAITVGAIDANGYNINEAGLFANVSNSGAATGIFTLFSKVTFPTIPKTASRVLVFVWYIYF